MIKTDLSFIFLKPFGRDFNADASLYADGGIAPLSAPSAAPGHKVIEGRVILPGVSLMEPILQYVPY